MTRAALLLQLALAAQMKTAAAAATADMYFIRA